jgi:uncharacterized ferritin-like protein (DUF455 family)
VGQHIVTGRETRVPPLQGFHDVGQRARILHALANHELQAVELFAFALLAFPDAPEGFRRGCLGILADEQRHFELYAGRLAALGCAFGDHAVSGHFWHRIADVTSPLQFVCVMGLTVENANLDFGAELAAHARAAGDEQTARVAEEVHADEVRHVAFGWDWLERLRGNTDAWTAYLAASGPELGPARARGRSFDRASRERAGIDAEFVARLEATEPHAPGGAKRTDARA